MSALGELKVFLGVTADTFTVKEFSHAVGEIPLSVVGAIASLAGLSLGILEMTKNVLDMNTGLSVFTAETGENSRALQQWQQVARQAGLSSDIVTGSLTSLSNIIGQMNIGNVNDKVMQGVAMLNMTGVPSSAYEFLNQIQAGVRGKDQKTATAILDAFGIPHEMMRVFQTPQYERENITPMIGEGQGAQLAEFQKSLADFNQVVMRSFVDILVKLEPDLHEIAEALAVLVHGGGGYVAHGIGYDAKLFNMINKQGMASFLNNMIDYYMPPENVGNGGRMPNVTIYQDIDVNGVSNAHEAGPIIGDHAKRPLVKAISDHTGNPK